MTESERLALEADRLLNHEPLLTDALAKMEADTINRLLRGEDALHPDRHRLEMAITINVIRDFKQTLHAYIRNGEVKAKAEESRNGGFV